MQADGESSFGSSVNAETVWSGAWPSSSARPRSMPNIVAGPLPPLRWIDRGDLEAEGLGADEIEAVRRDEQHFLLRNAEDRLDEGVTGPVRLVYSDAVDADRRLDPAIQPRVPDEFLQHFRAAVREDRELASLQRGERGRCFGIRVEVEIILHQGSTNVFIGLDPGRSQGKVERGARHLPEILVLLQQATQPCIFQLLQPPQLGDHFAFARTQCLGLRQHRLDVVERAVSVKNQRSNRGIYIQYINARIGMAEAPSRAAAVSRSNTRMNAEHDFVETVFMRIVATSDECPEHGA
jgi:hypothetical protein